MFEAGVISRICCWRRCRQCGRNLCIRDIYLKIVERAIRSELAIFSLGSRLSP